jgi:hypothetical protein
MIERAAGQFHSAACFELRCEQGAGVHRQYQSVIALGGIRVIEGDEEKRRALYGLIGKCAWHSRRMTAMWFARPSARSFHCCARRGSISIMAQLRFRRAFQVMMNAKGWNMPDIIMEEDESTALTLSPRRLYLPLILKQPQLA